MNHVHTMLKGDSDNVILGEISTNRREAFANLVRFIGLIDQCYVSRRKDHFGKDRVQTF